MQTRGRSEGDSGASVASSSLSSSRDSSESSSSSSSPGSSVRSRAEVVQKASFTRSLRILSYPQTPSPPTLTWVRVDGPSPVKPKPPTLMLASSQHLTRKS